MSNLEHALTYASKMKWKVFPCKRDKTPMTPNGFKNASSDTEQIKVWWTEHPEASIGLVCGEEAGVWVLDIDLKSNGPGSLEKLTEKHGPLPETLHQKTGGGGSQYFWKWNGREIRNSAGKIAPGIDVRGNGGYVILPPSGHPSGGTYEWLTKKQPIEAPDWLAELAAKKEDAVPPSRVPGTSSKYGETALARELIKLSCAPEGQRNQTLNECGYALGQLIAGGELNGAQVESALHGVAVSIGLTSKEARNTIRSSVKAGEEHPRSVERKDSIESVETIETIESDGNNRKQLKPIEKPIENQLKTENLKSSIKDWILLDNRSFRLQDLYSDFGAKTSSEKKTISTYLSQFCAEGLIERVGGRRGEFMHIEKEKESKRININTNTWVDNSINIYYPLGLDGLVELLPGNIAIVAGESNAGKTALLLDWAFNNLKSSYPFTQSPKNPRYETVNYFSSEMGEREMSLRARAFGHPIEAWSSLQAYERMDNFHQVIDPNGLNFVDFLEIHDEFYKVGAKIRSIHEALKDGICVIALQKKKGSEYGRGGEMSLEKPRLYISLYEPVKGMSVARIVKAKNFITDFNPNGMQIDFKIEHRGSRITPLTEWRFLTQAERDNLNKDYERAQGIRPPVGEYKFITDQGEVILKTKDVQGWMKAFTNIDVEKELSRLSADTFRKTWLKKGNWFYQVSNYLAKRDKESA